MSLAMGTEAQAQIDSLRERLAAAEAVAAEVARIKAINADLEARNALLELQNEKMRRTLYGQPTAFMLSLIGTAKLNDIDPQAWLADVLSRIADIPQNRLHELLPWNWGAPEDQRKAA